MELGDRGGSRIYELFARVDTFDGTGSTSDDGKLIDKTSLY